MDEQPPNKNLAIDMNSLNQQKQEVYKNEKSELAKLQQDKFSLFEVSKHTIISYNRELKPLSLFYYSTKFFYNKNIINPMIESIFEFEKHDEFEEILFTINCEPG